MLSAGAPWMHIDDTDVRNDALDITNRLLCWVFGEGWPRLLRRLASAVFHVELPELRYPVRMPHPHGVVIRSGVRLGRNVTLYQVVMLGRKRHGKNGGVPVLEMAGLSITNATSLFSWESANEENASALDGYAVPGANCFFILTAEDGIGLALAV